MRKTLSMFLLLVIVSVEVVAQSNSSIATDEIIDATVRALYEQKTRLLSKPNVVIKVDPIIFQGGRVPKTDPTGARHSEQILARVRGFSGATVVTSEHARECEAHAPAHCMSNGVSAVVRLSNPVITGDSGYVEVHLKASAQVSTADSIELSKQRDGGKLAMTLRRAGDSVLRVFVVKKSTGWVVSRIVFRSQA